MSYYYKLIPRVVWVAFIAVGLCHATDLNGVILDDQGQPVAGASVTVARSSVDGPLVAAEAYSAVTAADGTYTVKGLSSGPFIVCASIAGRALLDPCQWGSPAVIRVPAGTGTTNATTRLQLGAMVSIRVDDPARLLFGSAVSGKIPPFVSMGVWPSDGHFRPARHLSSDTTAHNFALVVPANTVLPFAVMTQNLAIADATTNAVISSAQRVSINLTPGATLQLHYTALASVTGN